MEILCMPRLVSTPLRRPPSAAPLPARRNAKISCLSFLPVKSVGLRKTESFSPRSSLYDDISAVKVDEQPGKVEITGQTEVTGKVENESPKEHQTPVPAVELASSTRSFFAEDASAVEVNEQSVKVVIPDQTEAAEGVETKPFFSDDISSNSSFSEDISAVEVNEQPGKVVITDQTDDVEIENPSPKDYQIPPAVEVVSSSEQESVESQFDLLQLFNGFNRELKQEDIYPILLYGGSAFLTVRISLALIGAIDSIPLIPKLLELVGLGYTIWFSYRYLIFKESRDELFAKIDQFKQEIIGSSEDD